MYLDSSNTSQKPRQVIDTLTEYYERHNANLYRAVYTNDAGSTASRAAHLTVQFGIRDVVDPRDQTGVPGQKAGAGDVGADDQFRFPGKAAPARMPLSAAV